MLMALVTMLVTDSSHASVSSLITLGAGHSFSNGNIVKFSKLYSLFTMNILKQSIVKIL